MNDPRAPGVVLRDLTKQRLYAATEAYPRNMGADLIELRDGRLLLGFSQWIGGVHDHDNSRVVGMISADRGQTWGTPFPIVAPREGIESARMPSFFRRRDGVLAVVMRCRAGLTEAWAAQLLCPDESRLEQGEIAWTVPVRITPPPPGRHIALNNRMLRLVGGRLLLPLSSPWPWDRPDTRGQNVRSWCLLSDDDGATWHPSQSMLAGPQRGLMEPYAVELSDGRLLMLTRTQMDHQYRSVSTDGGLTWSAAEPVPELVSPESPAAVGRDPVTGWLAVVWNYRRNDGQHASNRTPLTVGFSRDEGASWFGFVDLETDPDRAFSYPGLHFVDGRALVTYYEMVQTAPETRQLSLQLCAFTIEPETGE